MPRRQITLTDPVRRRLGDQLLEQRAFHIAQAERRRHDAHGLTRRYRSQMAHLRRELDYHARQAAASLDILEAITTDRRAAPEAC